MLSSVDSNSNSVYNCAKLSKVAQIFISNLLIVSLVIVVWFKDSHRNRFGAQHLSPLFDHRPSFNALTPWIEVAIMDPPL